MQTAADKKILVFGASGQVGYQLCQCLESKNINFKAACRSDSKHKDNLEKLKSMKSGGKNLEICYLDWNRPDTIKDALKDVDKIFLKTPIGKTIQATRTFCDCLKECKDQIKLLCFFSVLDADNKSYELGAEFGEAENLLKGLGINCFVVRPTFLFSNFLFDCNSIKEKNTICRPLGNNCVNIVSDYDVAECICQILLGGAQQEKIICIGGKECITMNEVADKLSNLLGKKVVYRDVGLDEFEKYMGGSGLSREGVQCYLGLMKFARDGGYNKHFNGYSKLLGKDPCSFQEMCQKEIECFK